MEGKNKGKGILSRVLGILGYVILAILVLFAAFSIFLTISSKKDSDGTATIFGAQLRFVKSSSMEKSEYVDVSQYRIKDIKVKSCIFIETVPTDGNEAKEWYSRLEVGDVLTFRYVYTTQETITHRITSISRNALNDGYTIRLMGDNRSSEDGALEQVIDTSVTDSNNYVIGKVIGQSYFLGLVIYAMKTPVGIVCIFILPCSLLIIWEVIRIVRVLNEDRNQKNIAAQKAKDDEIEKLKKQIEEMNRKEES